ncbi:hypothetical protein A3A79_04575 [Candidatus Gottesmanbacteria bacterium RIFCSPLOWO2_01_FULL_43_11b]|uniref:Metallopeptidase family protein n=1 Tax=Candidatus Gottesmanbacteria bacterium RIFCSPLOWO2_01_FULL_43_11b TaxID=1798392 RepID=A0A1F6AI78_9BACT|nr:MAG: hypothetical protein A3A79_04575 [Candidatus Gottesmanbacteria bacterium RIFCSPLOWO2_01_FULL_43_11b]
MTLREFEQLVAEALDSIPPEFRKLMDNVEVVVEVWPNPSNPHLFGLYHGVPQTKRTNYHSVLPDKISIFAGPIVMAYGDNPEVIKEQVRNTVLHEVGHHFGMSDEEIRRAEK